MNIFKKLFSWSKSKPSIPSFLSDVNKKVNQQVWYVADKGRDTLISEYHLKEGDCEDIAGTKAIHLHVDHNVDPEKMKPLLMRISFPNGTKNVWHMVLVVNVNDIEYVLDNNTDTVYTLDNLYKTLKVVDNKGFSIEAKPWDLIPLSGTRSRAKLVQDKYNKLFQDLLVNPVV